MKNYSAFDIIGPIMIGPSSSHTAGANRLAQVARKIAKEDIKKVKFLLHGSFAKTLKGHGTDRALLAGMLGMIESDESLVNALSIADSKGLIYEFIESDLGDVHPNTVGFVIENSKGKTIKVTGSSVGGGNIVITDIDGMKLKFTGEYPTLITKHRDFPGVISKVNKILADNAINIAFMSVYRQNKGQDAFMVIESDNTYDENLIQTIKSEVKEVIEVFIIEAM